MVVLTLALCLAVRADSLKADAVADTVVLRSGETLIGDLLERGSRGTTLLVPRAWARQNVPALAKRWEADEQSASRRVRAVYRSRLEAWKRDRTAAVEPDDRITPWIEQELARSENSDAEPSMLMSVKLRPNEVRQVVKAPEASKRLLRLAWRCKLANAAAATPDALKEELRDRGLDTQGQGPVKIDDLLPLQPESESQWLARRAATEVSNENGLRFLKMGMMFAPEPGMSTQQRCIPMPFGEVDGNRLGSDMASLAQTQQLRAIADRRRVGALITSQSNSADLDAATVTSTLWVRGSDGRWAPCRSKSSTIRAADITLAEAAANPCAVQMTTSFSSSFGFGPVQNVVRQSHPNLGTAARKARTQTYQAMQDELVSLALPLGPQ